MPEEAGRYETSVEIVKDPMDSTISDIIRDVAELPGDYRDDDPDVMRVSVEDLRCILRWNLVESSHPRNQA